METQAAAGAKVRELLAALEACVAAEAVTWLRGALPLPNEPLARERFFGAYAGAGRRMREPQGVCSAVARERPATAGVARPEVWSAADIARAALLLSACAVAPLGEHVALATEVFRKGDSAERIALLRSLSLLPDEARFVPLAAEACRTHVLAVFAAIACDNPLPARCFPEAQFNQLVIKTLFLELPLERVLGWRMRVGPELLRMADDYEAERRAAGRSVPGDIALLRTAQETP